MSDLVEHYAEQCARACEVRSWDKPTWLEGYGELWEHVHEAAIDQGIIPKHHRNPYNPDEDVCYWYSPSRVRGVFWRLAWDVGVPMVAVASWEHRQMPTVRAAISRVLDDDPLFRAAWAAWKL